MSRRMKFVIDKLYRPALTAGAERQVFAVSRVEAEQLPGLPTVAVISIVTPGRPPASLDGVEYLLRLQFEDVDFLNANLSKRAREKLPGAFTAAQARQIRSFVDGLPESVHSIVIHCEGGFSRSCAVALGLNKLYNFQVELERLEHANPSVVHILTTGCKSQV